MNVAALLLATLVSVLPLNVHSQELFLKDYTIDDGLPSNEIYQVFEDDSGNLLAATDRGAVKFDGYSFQNIKVDDQQSTIPFYYMYKTEGLVCFSGLKGSIYHYHDNRLSEYVYDKKIQAIFKHPGILIANTLSYHNDSLWISFNNDFNFNFNVGSCIVIPGGKTEQLRTPDGIYFDLYHNFFYRQLGDTNFHRTNQKIFINWADGSLTKDTLDLSWESGYIRRLFHGSAAGYHLFCMGRKIHIYKEKKKVGAFALKENILFMTVIGDRVYLGLENGGVSVYTINNGAFRKAGPNFLEGLTVTCVYKDHQGGIWFSTQENGLFYSYPSHAQYIDNKSKIVDLIKVNKKVYVGYASGWIHVLGNNNITQQFKLPLQGENNRVVFSTDKDDSLIAITDKGFYVRHSPGWKFYRQPGIHRLSIGVGKMFIAAADYAELLTYTHPGGTLLNKTVLQKRVISMLNDKSGRLWMGTWEGLYALDDFQLKDLTAGGAVFNDRIVSIKELPDTSVVVASLRFGIAVFKNGHIDTLRISSDINPSAINSMEVDNGDIWLGTNKGLVKISYKNRAFTFRNFGIENGLPTADIHQFTVANGILYVKWNNRLVTISVDSLLKPAIQPKTNINSVIVNDHEVLGKQSVFDHTENTFVFHYNSINLSSANQQVYYYLLQGFDVKWNSTKERSN